MTHCPKKVLVIGPAWIGDMVLAQTLFKLLKQQHDNIELDVAAPFNTAPLLSRMKEVHKTIILPFQHRKLSLIKRFKLGCQLQRSNYHQAVVLPNSWKSALIPFWAKIRNRRGWRAEMRYGLLNDCRLLNKQALPLMIERFLALGWNQHDYKTWLATDAYQTSDAYQTLTVNKNYRRHYRYQALWPSLVVDRQKRTKLLKDLHLDCKKGIVILCPGAAFGPAKCWPSAYFAKIAQVMLQQGYVVWIMGALQDQKAALDIQQLTTHRCVNLVGKTTLLAAIDLLSLASVVVTNDSGLMHLACALRRPVVAIYGSSSPTYTPPLSEKARIMQIPIACSPCFQRQCPLQHHRCMQDLMPSQVLGAIKQLR